MYVRTYVPMYISSNSHKFPKNMKLVEITTGCFVQANGSHVTDCTAHVELFEACTQRPLATEYDSVPALLFAQKLEKVRKSYHTLLNNAVKRICAEYKVSVYLRMSLSHVYIHACIVQLYKPGAAYTISNVSIMSNTSL